MEIPNKPALGELIAELVRERITVCANVWIVMPLNAGSVHYGCCCLNCATDLIKCFQAAERKQDILHSERYLPRFE